MFKRTSQPRNYREQKVAYWARRDERDRILLILRERHEDLISCTKNDDCKELARIVSVCIEDIDLRTEQ